MWVLFYVKNFYICLIIISGLFISGLKFFVFSVCKQLVLRYVIFNCYFPFCLRGRFIENPNSLLLSHL